MLEARGRWVQVLLNTALAAVCVVCYLLLLTLYLNPSSYQIESIIRPDRGIIKPAAVVGLLSVILAASTSTLVTRCVEHSLWIRLVSGPSAGRAGFFGLARDGGLTVGEVRRLALWSTSAFQRLSYLVELDNGPDRRSMLLRPTGPLLIAAAIAVGPVLLTGISQSVATTTTTQDIPRLVDPWKSRLDVGNMKSLGRWERDNPATMAGLVAMNNFTAPVAPLCNNITDDERQTCSVKARTLSIRAECSGTNLADTDGVGLYVSNVTKLFCADQRDPSELCVKLDSDIYGAFTSGRYPCKPESRQACSYLDESGWARLLGAWVEGMYYVQKEWPNPINRVECLLTHGMITVMQDGH
ncbi:hypothetical protein QBC40DRAFT_327045 [Triangularia verruculosa]|uniref:Uncharacterized protein n=1 Tax=Triangularia verruculosa TaxID=2587418 RepID=A0AAN7AWQ3_9PEZI|nr:hypothetical protein QBC40DRAFT_327045 [Triangularia verruculosa]